MTLTLDYIPRKLKVALIIVIIANIVLFIISLAFIIVFATAKSDSGSCDDPTALFFPEKIDLLTGVSNYNPNSKVYQLQHSSNKNIILRGRLGLKVDNEYLKDVSIRKNEKEIEIKFITKLPTYLASTAILKMTNENIKKTNDYEINCNHFEWSYDIRLEDKNQELEDCFSLDGYWYGGAESYLEQFWPINNVSHVPHRPYLTGLFGISSSVLERYWFSSNGVAIIVNQSIPLFVQMNKTDICFLANTNYPYSTKQTLKLAYDVCSIDHKLNNDTFLKTLHLEMIKRYFKTPSGIPDELMFKRPIWSTWATFKREINESVVLEFAKEIIENGYTNSQLEIDDKWQPAYGDFVFDTRKFPNATGMITELNQLGFRTTVWQHPFANVDSVTFLEKAFEFFWVRAPDELHPAFTAWWDGPAAGILDTTYPNASDWFLSELIKMQKTYGIDSFKFDAGEVEWLPKLGYRLYNETFSPDQYSIDYARMAAKLNNMIEVRTGCQTQDLPIFVRMLDKDSRWGFDNGLKSVVTTGLVMSILGYPFVLPDMIGGNAYGETNETDGFAADLSVTIYPDSELYIRWAQLTAFMPSMQYSIPPWHYNDTRVNDICKRYTDIHENIVFPILIDAAKNTVLTGEPIIRPMWWNDSNDLTNLIIDDQFLLSDKLLVAPILDKGAVKRNIYLPKGNWRDGYNNTVVYPGPMWLNDYPADLQIIPYFISA